VAVLIALIVSGHFDASELAKLIQKGRELPTALTLAEAQALHDNPELGQKLPADSNLFHEPESDSSHPHGPGTTTMDGLFPGKDTAPTIESIVHPGS
jgi:hypothetical protein